MAFNIVEFRSNARAVSKELFRGSLTDASEALKTLLGKAIEGFYQYNVCKKYDEKQFSSEIYIGERDWLYVHNSFLNKWRVIVWGNSN